MPILVGIVSAERSRYRILFKVKDAKYLQKSVRFICVVTHPGDPARLAAPDLFHIGFGFTERGHTAVFLNCAGTGIIGGQRNFP